jgi:hypothetical protein
MAAIHLDRGAARANAAWCAAVRKHSPFSPLRERCRSRRGAHPGILPSSLPTGATPRLHLSAIQTVRTSWSGIKHGVQGYARRYYIKPNLTTEAAEGTEKDLQHGRRGCNAKRWPPGLQHRANSSASWFLHVLLRGEISIMPAYCLNRRAFITPAAVTETLNDFSALSASLR